MLIFYEFTLENVDTLRSIIAASGRMGCEASPVCRFLWKDKYPTQWCEIDSYLITRYSSAFAFPVGPDDRERLKSVLEVLFRYTAEEGNPLEFWGLTREDMILMEELFPGKFEFTTSRDEWDYIYRSEDLIGLQGKKYQAKRNHISRFRREYSYEYQDITEENKAICREAARQWMEENVQPETKSEYESELRAISLALEHFEALRLRGGLLMVNDKVAAFTIGGEISSRVFDVYFEKAMEEFNGAYAVIHQEFARRNLAEYEFINREEDLGIPGLRKAKLSYHPAILLEKYSAVLR